jgi:exodeoxyribonuclease VII small subunit
VSADEYAGQSFEALLAQLRDTVALLDGAELTLDEAVAAYERCVALANACNTLLEAAELRVTQLNVSSGALRETAETYAYSSLTARRLLLGDDEDDLEDLLDDE